MTASTSTPATATTGQRRRMIIAFGLFFIVTLGYIDRINISVAAPFIIKEFGLSTGQFGLASSAFNWSYALLLVPLGVLADRVGAKVILPLAIVVWSLGTGLTGVAVGLGSLIAARLVMGVGESPVFPVGNLVIREWAPAHERGRFSGVLNAGTLAGPAAGAVVSAYLISAFGWRESFYVLAVFGIVVGTSWYFVYSKPENCRWLGRDERDIIISTRDVEDTAGHASVAMSLGKLLRTKTIWGLMVTQGCAVYTNYLFLAFLPLYLIKTRGLGNLGAGWVTGLTYGIAAIGSIVVAGVSDRAMRGRDVRTGARRKYLITMLLLGLPLVLLPWVSGTVVIVILISWVLIAVISSIALNFALAGDMTVDRGSGGRVFGLVTLGGNAFGLLAPIVTGYVVDWTGSYRIPFIIAALLLLVGAALTAALSRRPLQPSMPQPAAT